MNVKELNKFRRKMFDEIIKDTDVANVLKTNEQALVLDVKKNDFHKVIVVSQYSQVNGFLKDNNLKLAYIDVVYRINKQTKQCY